MLLSCTQWCSCQAVVTVHLLTFPGGTTEAGKRGQSQYAQFLRRSSADMGQAKPDLQQFGMELPRRSIDSWQPDRILASGQSATTTPAAALAGGKLPTASPSAQQASPQLLPSLGLKNKGWKGDQAGCTLSRLILYSRLRCLPLWLFKKQPVMGSR